MVTFAIVSMSVSPMNGDKPDNLKIEINNLLTSRCNLHGVTKCERSLISSSRNKREIILLVQSTVKSPSVKFMFFALLENRAVECETRFTRFSPKATCLMFVVEAEFF